MNRFMFYTVYKVTNKVNGKVYIGTHKTKNLDDGYMGSGKYLKRAIAKYGRENFLKEILFVLGTQKEMYEKETEIVNENFIRRLDTYNIKLGGYGSFDFLNDGSKKHKDRCSKAGKIGIKTNAEKRKEASKKSEKRKQSSIKNLEKARKKYPNGTFFGKTHNEESKNKIGLANSKMKGDKNSSFGKYWYYDSNTNKNIKCKPEEVPKGYIKGRKINY
jgi:hypothetical protein